MPTENKRPVLMRIAVPFIAKKPDFDGRELIEGRDTQRLHAYALALALELRANAGEFGDCRVTAIRLDGGSASMLEGSDLERLLRLIREDYDVAADAPLSMSTCPADINGANMPFFNRAHITRYDLEFYSLEPQDFIRLDTLNYMDQLPYISSGFLRAGQRGNMGFVLLYGKKTVSRWGFRRSILETVRRPVRHLILQRCQGGDCLNEAEAEAQLAEADETLSEQGFRQYLPATWAREGCEDPVLLGEARGAEMLGFGLGARTRFDGALTRNTADYDRYIRHSDRYELITEEAVTGDREQVTGNR